MCFNIKGSLSKDKAELSSVTRSQCGTEACKLNKIKKPPHKIWSFMSLHITEDLREKGKNKRKRGGKSYPVKLPACSVVFDTAKLINNGYMQATLSQNLEEILCLRGCP